MTKVAVVVPTYNESANIAALVARLQSVLSSTCFEIVFVDDDSPDNTSMVVRQLASENPSIRLLHRINRRGLASACMEGMLSTTTPYICVMDADLQHDETIIPVMIGKIESGLYDVVVGSRNVEGGSMGSFSRQRVWLSTLGKLISRKVTRCNIQDPMSGFFIVTRAYLLAAAHGVSAIGFKILVDLLASSRTPARVAEVPYTFRPRHTGESKLDLLVSVEYLELILDKWLGTIVPASFILYSLIGAIGVLLYSIALWLQLSILHLSFGPSQLVAALLAMTANFTFNNAVTYRDIRLRGWNIFRGLLIFYGACTVGLILNLRVAELALHAGAHWLVAGFIGLVVGSVWNYGVTNVLAWNATRKKAARARV